MQGLSEVRVTCPEDVHQLLQKAHFIFLFVVTLLELRSCILSCLLYFVFVFVYCVCLLSLSIVFGFWLLAFGFWLLAFVFCLLFFVF